MPWECGHTRNLVHAVKKSFEGVVSLPGAVWSLPEMTAPFPGAVRWLLGAVRSFPGAVPPLRGAVWSLVEMAGSFPGAVTSLAGMTVPLRLAERGKGRKTGFLRFPGWIEVQSLLHPCAPTGVLRHVLHQRRFVNPKRPVFPGHMGQTLTRHARKSGPRRQRRHGLSSPDEQCLRAKKRRGLRRERSRRGRKVWAGADGGIEQRGQHTFGVPQCFP